MQRGDHMLRVQRFFFYRRTASAAAAQEESQYVGALRKHAGGMFLASDLGGYAAVASIWIYTAKLEPYNSLRKIACADS